MLLIMAALIIAGLLYWVIKTLNDYQVKHTPEAWIIGLAFFLVFGALMSASH